MNLPRSDLSVYTRGSHVVVRKLDSHVFFPEAQSLRVTDSVFGSEVEILLTALHNDGFYIHNEEKAANDFVLSFAKTEATGSRMLFMGTGRIFESQHIDIADNSEFILASIRWLLKERQIGWVDSREIEERRLDIDEKDLFFVKIFYFYIYSGIIIIFSLVFWLRRRFY